MKPIHSCCCALLVVAAGTGRLQAANPVLRAGGTATNRISLSAQTVAPALVLQSSTDLASWRDEMIAVPSAGLAKFSADISGFDHAFFRAREAAAGERPNPLHISPTPNPDFVLTKNITAEGGSLRLTDDNGTTYELTLPAGALAGFATISMQVVNVFTNLPLQGGLTGGVILQPEGLWFFVPATLAITPASPLPAQNLFGFGWAGSDGSFHLVPTVITKTNAVVFSLTQLSSLGLGAAAAADLTNLVAHPPANFQDQYAQNLALALVPDRAGLALQHVSIRSYTDQAVARAVARFQQQYTSDVLPALNEALGNDDLVDEGLQTLNRWISGIQFIGSEDGRVSADLAPETHAALMKAHDVVIHALEDEYSHCLDHDLGRIARLIAAGRWTQTPLIGPAFTDSERQLYRNYALSCAQFEFEMDSDMLFTIPNLGSGHTIVKTLVPIKMELNAQNVLTSLKGSASVRLFQTDLSPNVPAPCVYSGNAPVNGFGYVDTLDLGLNQPSRGHSAPPVIRVLFNPFLPGPDENYHVTCPGAGMVNFQSVWNGFFPLTVSLTGAPSGIPKQQDILLDGWTIARGSEEAATLEDFGDANSPAGHANVDTHFILHHTPSSH